VERQTDMEKVIGGLTQLLISNALKAVTEFYH
jgi:hypothetical protein